MSKYQIGDIITLKGIILDRAKTNYRMRLSNGKYIWIDESNIQDNSKTYEDGLADAWELARKIADIPTTSERADIFGYCCGGITITDILRNFTYQEALTKIEAYEKSHQIPHQIQVGDVVKVKTGAVSEHIGVVTQITANQNCACVVYADGSTEMNTANNMIKTNKHLDISHLLEQIKGDENENIS